MYVLLVHIVHILFYQDLHLTVTMIEFVPLASECPFCMSIFFPSITQLILLSLLLTKLLLSYVATN